MKRLFDAILAHPKLMLVGAVLLAAIGWRVAQELPVDVFPEIREPRVVVQVEAGGLSAEEVEQFVTIPIEAVMNGIPGVRKVRSSSGGGLAFVWVEFDWDVELAQARFSVFERLATVREQLPEGVRAEIAPVVSVTGEIMLVALTCPKGETSLLNVREMAEFDLRTRLLSVPGIGDVVVMGGHLPEYQVLASPSYLAQYGLTLNDVIGAVEGSRTMASAGYLPHVAGEEIPLRQFARADSLEALRRIVVPTPDGRAPRLGDVARVTLGGAPRRGSASFAGSEAVILSVQKAPGANTLELTKRLDAILDDFAALHASDGLEVHREAYRQADFIGLSIAEGRSIIRDAVLIVVLVLGLTLLRVRTILITLLTMPLTVLTGLALFPRFGLGVNVMTLGGLAVGIGDIVDSAIIFVEIIWRRLGENAARPEAARETPVAVIGGAACEVLPSVTFSTVIIALVFVPLLLLTGLESRFFAPLALAYLLVFGASFFVALTVVPALSLLLWRTPKRVRAVTASGGSAGDSVATRAMKAAYRPVLGLCLRFPKSLCCAMAVLLAGSLYLAAGFGASFIQSFREDAFNVFVSTPPGTSLEETERIADNASDFIRGIPGVLSVLRRTGRAERDQHAEPPSASELVVRVDMKADANAVRDEIRRGLASVPGVSTMVGYPIAHRISAALSGTEAEVAISVFGENLDVLREVAAKAQKILATVPEVADVRANREIMVSTYRIDYDLEALAEMGLSLKDAGEQVSAAFNGRVVETIRSGVNVRELVVRLDAAPDGLTPETVRSLVLASPTGARRALSEVARVSREDASNLIIREGGRRKALITCNAAPGSDTGTLVAALRTALEPTVRAAGCTIAYGGSYEARQSAGSRLAVLGGALLAAIFVLLTMALRTAGAAALVMLNVPLGLMGGIVAVQVTDPVLSVASLVGFVTVVGFVLRNGLLLLNRYRELEEVGLSAREAIEVGSTERMVPILMTSLTTILGLVPIVLAANKPGGELLAPLAIVQFGGLVSATVLNMLVLPAAALLARERKQEGRDMGKYLFGVALLSLAGCRLYEPRPVDWAQETRTWQVASARVALGSLQDATTLALLANPEINRLRLKAQRSRDEVKAVGWWEDPQLDIDFLRVLNADEYPNIFGGSLAFTVPLSGVPGLETRAAERYAEGDALAVKAAEQRLAVEVRVGAIRWAAAQRRAQALGAQLKDARIAAAETRAAKLVTLGEAEEAELSAARRRRHAQSHASILAERDRETARTAFCRVLGVLPTAEVTIPADAWPTSLPQTADVPLPSELAAHLEVRAAQTRLGGSEAALHAEIRRQYPNLSVGPAYSKEDGFDRLGFVASLTLPLWNRNRQGIARAETERDLSRLDAIETWKALVSDSVAAVRLVRGLRQHAEPEGLSLQTTERLHATGELGDLAYLAVRDEILEAELEEIAWRESLLVAEAELGRYEVKK